MLSYRNQDYYEKDSKILLSKANKQSIKNDKFKKCKNNSQLKKS